MRFISRFNLILERKGYLEKLTIYPNTMARSPKRREVQCSCIGLRPTLLVSLQQIY